MSEYKIIFENLNYTPGKDVIKNVSSAFKSNSMTAIMGPSGSGKTTIIKMISGRFNKKFTGKIVYDGKLLKRNEMMKRTAFIHQNDILLSFLTVKETLEFVCKMRNKELDYNVIEILGLTEILNSFVGNETYGISAGERKRLCIALQLIDQPEIIFLDEPTSGLDSLNALKLITHLKELSKKSTIISTIHQPSSEIFFLFDDLLLLNKGEAVYDGKVSKIFDFFADNKMTCPQFSNPADFLFTMILPNIKNDPFKIEKDAYSEFKRNKISKYGDQETIISINFENDEENNKKSYKSKNISKFKQFCLLFQRNLKCIRRNKLRILTKFLMPLTVAFVISTIFSGTYKKDEIIKQKNIVGVMYFFTLNCLFNSAMTSLSDLYLKSVNLIREYQSNYYRFFSFFAAEILCEIFFTMIHPIITIPISLYFMKFPFVFTKFMIILSSCIMTSAIGYSLAVLTSSIFPTLQMASIALPTFLMPFTILNGLLVDPSTLHFFLKCLQYLSPTRYSFNILLKNEFLSNKSDLSDAYKSLVTDFLSIRMSFLILFVMLFTKIILAYFILKRKIIKSI